MIDLPAVVAFLGGLLVLASALGALIAGTRTATLRSTVTDQQAAIVALRERVTVAEESERDCKVRISNLEDQVEGLSEANRVLAATVTGATKLTEIARAQVELAKTATDRHSEIVGLLAQLVSR